MAKKPYEEYIPLDASGNDYASMVGMSALHQAAIDAAKNSFLDAQSRKDQAGMDAAHAQAEAVRALYNYSGGNDGSQYLPTEQKKSEPVSYANRFTYESAPQYTSKYQNQIAALTQQLLNREAFSYDYTRDENFKQLEGQYARGGQQAMRDTLGQLAARTGGMASSYAGSAAQQAYNEYMAGLAGMIPELRQAAFEMYQADYDRERANIDALAALEESEYNRYLNNLGQYNADRSFAYGAYQDQLDRDWQQRLYDYQVGQDQQAANQWQQNFDYNAMQDALGWGYQAERDQVQDARYDREYADTQTANKWDQDLKLAQQLAAAGDYSGYRALGFTDEQIRTLETAANTPGEYEPRLSYNQVMTAIENGQLTPSVLADYEYWVGAPYTGEGAPEQFAPGDYTGIVGDLGIPAERPNTGDYGLEDMDTGSIAALGIGPAPGYGVIEELVDAGALEVYQAANGKIGVRWANGYNAKNYEEALKKKVTVGMDFAGLLG